MKLFSCFKAYDIRGRLGDELNDIGRAFGQRSQANRVAVGGDIRESSPALKAALARGLMDAGVDVIDLGVTGTEEIYFAAYHLDVDGAIEVTASHNPIDYNGMKLVGRGARPISGDSGLDEIRALAESAEFVAALRLGQLVSHSILSGYIEHLLTYVDTTSLRPLRLIVNAGNGAAGHVIDALEQRFLTLGVCVEFIKIYHEADGSFPNDIPNPLLPENRVATAKAVFAYQLSS